MIKMLKNLWAYRFFIISSVNADFKNKFARSKMGSIWIILNPLAQVLMYTVILSAVLSSKLPGITNKYGYAIYLLAGMLCWSLFTDLIVKSSNLFVDNSNLIKKMVFPKLALPTIMVGVSLINNLVLFFSMLFVFAILGQNIGIEILWILPLSLITIFTGLGFGIVLGVLNVFVRDISQIVPIMLQFSFWFTPIVYPVTVIPEKYIYLLNYNPFFAIVSSYQKVFVFGQSPEISRILIASTISLFALILGLFIYKKASSDIVDFL
jgi:lipopolysaccharide transport system permease protein